MTTALTRIPDNVPAEIVQDLQRTMPAIAPLLPPDIPIERFEAGLWLQIMQQPQLAECTSASLAKALIKAATKGLEPGRDCSLLPFKNRKLNRYEAQLIEEYQGVLRRLDRTGRVAWAKADVVFLKDHFVCDELAEIYEFRKYLDGDRGKVRCYFSAIKLRADPKPLVRVCTLDEVEEVKRLMGRGEYEVWVKWPHEMGKKTALKRHGKYLQLLDETAENDEPVVIPDSRAQKNIADLWGDTVSTVTGEIVESPAPEPTSAVAGTGAQDPEAAPAAQTEDPPFSDQLYGWCEEAGLGFLEVSAYVMQRFGTTSLDRLTVGQKRLARNWCTTADGMTHLTRLLQATVRDPQETTP